MLPSQSEDEIQNPATIIGYVASTDLAVRVSQWLAVALQIRQRVPVPFQMR